MERGEGKCIQHPRGSSELLGVLLGTVGTPNTLLSYQGASTGDGRPLEIPNEKQDQPISPEIRY